MIVRNISIIFNIFLFVSFTNTSIQANLVDMSIEPAVDTVSVGDYFNVGIWLRDDGQTGITTVVVNFGWDENFLQLNNVSQGDYKWNSFVENNLSGNPDYTISAKRPRSNPTTDFLFASVNLKALAQTPNTNIVIYNVGLSPTQVLVKKNNVTGSFIDGNIIIVPEPTTICILGLGCLLFCKNGKIK